MGWAFLEFVNHLIGKWDRVTEFKRSQDGGSYWLLIGLAFISILLACAGRWLGLGVFTGPGQYLGLGLMLAGIIFREWAIIILGRHYSVVVAIESEHRLITRPPYRWLRHPAYSGGFAAAVGFHLALGSWGTAMLTIVILTPAFLYRIRLEEQALLQALGSEYQTYMQRTWRLFPGW